MAQSSVVRIDEYTECRKYFTIEEAREVIRAEAEFEQRRKEAERARLKEERKYFFKQKLAGTGIAAIAAATFFVTGDATASLIIAPIGLFAMFTKSRVLTVNH